MVAAEGLNAYKRAAENSMTAEQMILKIWENNVTFLNMAVGEYREKKSSCFNKIAVVMKVLSEFIVGSMAFSEEYGDSQEGYDIRLIYSYMIRQLDRLVDFEDPRPEEFFKITDEMIRYATEIRDTFAEAIKQPGYTPVSQIGGDIERFLVRLGNVA